MKRNSYSDDYFFSVFGAVLKTLYWLNNPIESKAAKDVKQYNENLRKDLKPEMEVKTNYKVLNEKTT